MNQFYLTWLESYKFIKAIQNLSNKISTVSPLCSFQAIWLVMVKMDVLQFDKCHEQEVWDYKLLKLTVLLTICCVKFLWRSWNYKKQIITLIDLNDEWKHSGGAITCKLNIKPIELYSVNVNDLTEFTIYKIYNTKLHSYLKINIIWATSWENLFMPYANNKGADQPAHLRSLISAFVVHYLDSIIPWVSILEISRLYLASVAKQAHLSLNWSKKTRRQVFLWLISHISQALFTDMTKHCSVYFVS